MRCKQAAPYEGLIGTPVRLAACDHLLQVHDVWVAALLQHPDLPHGCDWDACKQRKMQGLSLRICVSLLLRQRAGSH